RLDVLCPASVDVEKALGATAILLLEDPVEGSSRSIGLIVTDVTDVSIDNADAIGFTYAVTLRAPAWGLTLRGGYKIFQMAETPTAKDIIAKVLTKYGLSGDNVAWRLAGKYATRPQCTQYDERDWDFVERLLAEEGISYWFDWKDGTGPTLVFGD